MSDVRRERRRRWALVALTTAVLLAIPVVAAALPTRVAATDPELLRELILDSADRPYSGYAESAGTLGLPELPNFGDVTSLLTDTTRIRAWYGSPQRWRFAVLSADGERNVYRTPEAEFIWDYRANLLTKVVGEPPVRLPRAGDLLPPDLARRILQAAGNDPVSGLPARRVAGLAAAGLRLVPADPATTIGQVDIWADPSGGLPVQVEVTARGGSRPILVSRFLELSQEEPAAEALTPPPPAPGSGYSVTTSPEISTSLRTLGGVALPTQLAGRQSQTSELAGVRGVGLYGSGLSAFVALPLRGNVARRVTEAAGRAGATVLELPGGTGVALSIPPMSIVIANSTVARRSYLLAGLVDPAVLAAAAGELSTFSGGQR